MATISTITQLPKDFFLSAATLAGDGNQKLVLTEHTDADTSDQEAEAAAGVTQSSSVESQTGESGPTCVTCGIGVSSPAFESQTEQRLHFKGDWHRFNVKLRSVGKTAVDEAEFERLVSEKDEVSSISGSDTDSDDEASVSGRPAAQKSSQLMFKSQGGKVFAVWRPVIISEQDGRSLPDVELLQRLVAVTHSAQCWAVILSKGGHFSAAVFDLRPMPPVQHSKANAPLFKELAHKSYHRYVVRAKAGGRQSSKDATGKSIKSAGAQIRRYNEAALEKEIKDTLAEWKQLLARADRIFVQASVSNARPIFGGEDAALIRSDPRIRSIPFNTRRPTFSETKRVLYSLLSVFEPSNHVLQALNAPAKPAAPKPPKHSPQKAAVVAAEPEPSPVKELDPPLHEAAKAGDADKVKSLLEGGADPCQADSRGKVPYDVAADKPVRDAFRRFMASEPDKWDYSLAGVPSPLTDEMESQQMAKQAEKKAKQREKEKERKRAAAEKKAKAAEGARAAAEAEVTTAAAEAAALAARSKQGRASKPAALSRSEQEASKRREQMAAAAEARMRGDTPQDLHTKKEAHKCLKVITGAAFALVAVVFARAAKPGG